MDIKIVVGMEEEEGLDVLVDVGIIGTTGGLLCIMKNLKNPQNVSLCHLTFSAANFSHPLLVDCWLIKMPVAFS